VLESLVRLMVAAAVSDLELLVICVEFRQHFSIQFNYSCCHVYVVKGSSSTLLYIFISISIVGY